MHVIASVRWMDYRTSLCHCLINAWNQHKISRRNLVALYLVPSLEQVNFAGLFDENLLLIARFISFSQNFDTISPFNCSTQHSSQDIKSFVVALMVHFGSVDVQRSLTVTFWNFSFEVGCLSFVVKVDELFDSFVRGWEVLDTSLN